MGSAPERQRPELSGNVHLQLPARIRHFADSPVGCRDAAVLGVSHSCHDLQQLVVHGALLGVGFSSTLGRAEPAHIGGSAVSTYGGLPYLAAVVS